MVQQLKAEPDSNQPIASQFTNRWPIAGQVTDSCISVPGDSTAEGGARWETWGGNSDQVGARQKCKYLKYIDTRQYSHYTHTVHTLYSVHMPYSQISQIVHTLYILNTHTLCIHST